MSDNSSNKRVVKNALALTLRMVLVTVVGLYTSRVVLEALGVEDYGIYGVIGGIVGMASFLNAAMAGATSRFITFELGRGNESKLKSIFSTALNIHLLLAIVVVILAETVGLWFLNSKMNIPAERMFAANILYQFSVASVIVGFTQVPYAADIIAHEKMNIYAYFEIVNVVLKLVIVYILLILQSDRLIWYAAMVFCVSLLSALFYRIYCIRHFSEARFSLRYDRNTAKEMLKFSVIDLYGHMCAVAKTQGQPIVLNLFFGVVANAGATIAITVIGALSGLTTTVSQAFNPQIVKQYAAGDIEQMSVIMRRSIQFTILAFGIVAIPFVLETPSILYLWLGRIPPYSVTFFRLAVLCPIINIIVTNNNIAVHATGDIKRVSFISGTFYLLCPIITYFVMKFNGPAQSGYITDIILIGMVSMIGVTFVRRQIKGFPTRQYITSILRIIITVALGFGITFIATSYPQRIPLADASKLDLLLNILITSGISLLSCSSLAFLIGLGKPERAFILRFVQNKILRKRKPMML